MPLKTARVAALLGALCTAALSGLSAQQAFIRDTTVVAGRQYGAGGLHRWLFGTNYRQLWTAPVRAPIVDLRGYAGGLEPTREGGGMQTRSLRFRGRDGYSYNFRSVDKDPNLLPEILEGTFLDDIIRDQTRAQHPGAALVVAPLLEAAGVLHTRPILVVLPDAPELDSFRREYAGMLGYLERRATVEENRPGFAGAIDIEDTEEVVPKVFESPDDRIDVRAFLTARLMDIYMGDWDRHRGQWDWALLREGRPRLWVPIPKDRDHAFVKFDGLLPGLARRISVPQLVEFSGTYSDLRGMAWNGRDLDRWFLGQAEAPVWDSIALFLQSRMTDSVIESAVAALPEGWRSLIGADMITALRQRREGLPRQARRFYRMLAREAEAHLTGADEDVVIERVASGAVVFSAAARGRPPYFARTYQPGETHELRVFARGGDDRVVIRGDGPDRITIRIIGEAATVIDSSRAGGVRRYSHYWIPPPRNLRPPPPDTTRVPRSNDDSELEAPPRLDYGTSAGPTVWFNGGPDLGILVGLGLARTAYRFRHDPWGSRWTARAGWATQAGGRLSLSGVRTREDSRARTELEAWASHIELMRWHGIGNETARTQGSPYYRVSRGEVAARGHVALPLARHMELRLGPRIEWAHTRAQAGRIIADSQPYGAGDFGMAGLQAEVEWDTRDYVTAPSRGLSFILGGSAYPGVWDVATAFSEVHAEASTYLTARGAPLRPSLALRAGGKKVFGRYPFHEAAFIGDPQTVRLGRQNRFGGDAAAWAGTELRLALTRFDVILPGELGVFGLAETGRVFVRGEDSDVWHPAVGGGIWFSLVQPKNVVSVAFARSAERTALYLKAGLSY